MKPFIKGRFKLERFDSKGGWTYCRLPKPAAGRSEPVSKVKGSIDGYDVSKVHLQSFGGAPDTIMFPIRAEIRKKIRKEEGDHVLIVLYPDNDPLTIPKELKACLLDEPRALKTFNALTVSQKKYYIDWILSAKRVETKVGRLTKAIDMLSRGKKMYEPE